MSKFRGAGTWRNQVPARSNTGTVRGLPISHPIPFPDDDEFPIRTPGTGLAIPLGPNVIESPAQIIGASMAAEAENASHQTGIAVSDYTEASMATQPTSVPSQPSPETLTYIRRTTQPSAIRNSMASVPSGSSMGKPRRKKSSSLKTVLGRLFGRKSKRSPPSSVKKQSSGEMRAGLHRSDPTALNRSPKDSPSSQKRSASLPINEFNRALRSHSVVADDFAGLNRDNETKGESLETEDQGFIRRPTTPNRLWTPTRTPGYHNWTGLSPRPASSHARGSRAISQAEAETIGTAITSGSHPNRRSRSLGELRDAADRPLRRRRSDEIRYWRASYDPGPLSPISSNANRQEEPTLADEPGVFSGEEHHQESPQPFNFGPLGEMAGMKITQAANLETRVWRLEERMFRIENIISRSHREADALPQEPPKRNSARLSRYRSSSADRPTTNNLDMFLLSNQRYRDPQPRQLLQEPTSQSREKRSSSYGSSRPSTLSTHNSYHPSFDTFNPENFPPPEGGQATLQNVARPLSTSTTIRGIPSCSPPMPVPKDGYLTGEHYTTLTNMVLAEQVARQNLEDMVNNLQQQLRVISSTSAAYPTAASSHADPLNEDNTTTGEFSSFENDSSDDEGRYGHDEVFQTPIEDREQFGDEIFGDVSSNSSEANKNAPRTLSLSQITLGRGVQHGRNF